MQPGTLQAVREVLHDSLASTPLEYLDGNYNVATLPAAQIVPKDAYEAGQAGTPLPFVAISVGERQGNGTILGERSLSAEVVVVASSQDEATNLAEAIYARWHRADANAEPRGVNIPPLDLSRPATETARSVVIRQIKRDGALPARFEPTTGHYYTSASYALEAS